MAIPVHLQQFKAAGIYRVVFDKSTVLGVDAEVLRLVVGYSENGPFNIPTYITSVSDFKAIYGDVSKKLEKRGIYFHRIAIQALGAGPILCLNLKKFSTETVDGASINTNFNPTFEPIDTVKLAVEDIYDTTRFWELSADKLNGLRAVDGSVMDQYINICTTNTSKQSGTYFIRKASGNTLNQYKITVSDWYADNLVEMPDYLENYRNSLLSDFFAEIYVFKGKFNPNQVLASSTLKNYFAIETDEKNEAKLDEDGNPKLKLRQYVTNAYGDAIDTLDALYNDETSGALAHYVGCLIPYFKTKQGGYASLDILFNCDQGIHNMMMSFNVDMLEESGSACIDLSGRRSIPTSTTERGELSLEKLFDGTAKTTLLCNESSPVIVDVPEYTNNIVKKDLSGRVVPVVPFNDASGRRVMGTLYVADINYVDESASSHRITLRHVGSDLIENGTDAGKYTDAKTVVIDCGASLDDTFIAAESLGAATSFSISKADEIKSMLSGSEADMARYREVNGKIYVINENGYGSYWKNPITSQNDWGTDPAFIDEDGTFSLVGPQKVITAITRVEKTQNSSDYTDEDRNMKVTLVDVICQESSNIKGSSKYVYNSSVTFLPLTSDSWDVNFTTINGSQALVCDDIYDNSLFNSLSVGDCLLADDGSTDTNNDGETDDPDGFLDNVYVQQLNAVTDEVTGKIVRYEIIFSGKPLVYTASGAAKDGNYLVRIDNPINQEIGTIRPQYLEGYVYANPKPAGTTMLDKLQWQEFILSALTEYKGLRTGLLNKSDIDYRYIVDTFETYIDVEAKSVLSFIAKEKQSAFAILNFPSVKTFIKCPYSGFTDNKGVFNVQYIVDGANKKKPAARRFSLPSDANGASFCAFYSPLKFSDGYVDTIIPSAGLVSNLFMEKYLSRQPYYIIAGPNYGRINAGGLVGPDYKYSQEELNIIEPFGVNCMIYRPGFGTFINANQTAKQTPVSALSKVNVRELVIYLQDEIEKVLQSYQWEFNNARTRNAILDKANAICARVAATGGLQAYMNIMDESNNTPEIIDNEMAVLSTHIEPGMGCGKMVHELTLYRTGQMSAAIKD